MPCYSPLKGWRNEETGGIVFKAASSHGATMEVACSQCLGCRLDRSRMWAMRIVHESCLYESNCFVTLTYRDIDDCDERQRARGNHIPPDWSLHKVHLQKFMKRLRKHFTAQTIRFFACGEYGRLCRHGLDVDRIGCVICNWGRPHYHVILFNCSFSDLEPYASTFGELRYTSATLERIWGYGFVDVGSVSFESAAYVARYCMKKITGVRASEVWYHDEFGEWFVSHYFDPELGDFKEPEFSVMSRRPGLAYDWYQKFKTDLFPSDTVPVPGSGVMRGMPRYYEQLFALEDPVSMAEIKELRQQYKQENAEEFTIERLRAKYLVKQAQVDLLKRTIS